MLYLYAYTNHKENLDSLRRVKAIYEALKKEGIEAEILLNEYRAQLLARDWGLPLATTIETIKDIDAIATIDDIVIIDSPEELDGKVLEYGSYFKKVIYISPICNEQEIKEAINIKLSANEYIYTNFKDKQLKDKTIYIYGDSDPDKTILKNIDQFKDKNLDLYWGNYFFIKYEEALSKVFNTIIEAEDYYQIFKEYQHIITSSIDVALTAKANNLNVLYLELTPLNQCQKEQLQSSKIPIKNSLINYSNILNKEKNIINNIENKIIYILNNYM